MTALNLWRGLVVAGCAVEAAMLCRLWWGRLGRVRTLRQASQYGLASQVLLHLYVVLSVMSRWGGGLTWRTPLASLAVVLGAVGLRQTMSLSGPAQ